MFNTSPEGILQLISHGESDSVEFKIRLPPDSVLAKNLTAFANTRGGILLLGVGEHGEIIGLADEESGDAMARLHAIAASLFPWAIEIGVVDIKGKHVVYAVIDRAPRYYAPVMGATGEVYVRRGVANVKSTWIEPSSHPVGVRQVKCLVFVAMSFREEQEPALVDYYQAMKRAVERTKMSIELRRIDLVEGDYEISQKLMDEIDQADVVLADFTMSPANVYFEVGYARGQRKRIVQTARKDTPLEFDVRNWRTCFYRNATELEEKLALELRAVYREVQTDPERS